MMGELREAKVVLTDGKMHFVGSTRDCTDIHIDYPPPHGEGMGHTSLELFLMSLASCSGSSVAVVLRKMGKQFSKLSVSASGVRREKHPTSFEQIRLTFGIVSDEIDDESIKKAIKISEETLCPVWAMIKNNVEIIPEFSIQRSAATTF
jgi:putative redox protein